MRTVIYYNVTTGETFDQNGTLRTVNNPFLAGYGERKILEWHLMKSADSNVPVTSWIPWTDWDITPSLAFTAADDNYIAAFPGALKESASGGCGAVTIIPETDPGEIAPSGRLRFFRNDSSMLELDYRAYQRTSKGYIFSAVIPEEESFPSGTKADIIQSPLVSSDAFLRDVSDPENGIFVFDLSISGWRLSRIMEYSNTEKLSVKGLELTVAGTDPETTAESVLIRCQAPFAIKGVLNLFRNPAALPENQISAVQEWMLGVLSNGITAEYLDQSGNWSSEKENAVSMRWKLAGVPSMPWSPEIPLA